jgi:hypothetical protein
MTGRVVCMVAALLVMGTSVQPSLSLDAPAGWKLYTNARYGFSVRYPDEWRLGDPMPDGAGVTLYPPIQDSLVALSGHLNLVQGGSQDGRQTLDEFATAHRRIITDLYQKRSITVTWGKEQDTTLAGWPAKKLTFSYVNEKQVPIIEYHLFTLGRNEGRGIRIKVPRAEADKVMPQVKIMLETYQPGRDQNAISPLVPTP